MCLFDDDVRLLTRYLLLVISPWVLTSYVVGHSAALTPFESSLQTSLGAIDAANGIRRDVLQPQSILY